MSAGVIQQVVASILPELEAKADELIAECKSEAEKLIAAGARAVDAALGLPPILGPLLTFALERLLARGSIVVETSGQITIVGHKGPHPDDA